MWPSVHPPPPRPFPSDIVRWGRSGPSPRGATFGVAGCYLVRAVKNSLAARQRFGATPGSGRVDALQESLAGRLDLRDHAVVIGRGRPDRQRRAAREPQPARAPFYVLEQPLHRGRGGVV